MPLRQVQFKTNTFTGTQAPEGAGTALARLITAGATTATKINTMQKQMTDEEKKLQDEQDRIAYLTSANEYKKKFNEKTKNGELAISDDVYAFNQEYLKKSDSLFVNKDSSYRHKYDSFILEKDSLGHTLLQKENEKAYDDMMTQGISDLNLGDLNMEEINGITESGKWFKPRTNNGDTISIIMSNTAMNMQRDLSNATEYVNKNEDVPTREDIIKMYGGDTLPEIKDKNSKAYKAFEDTATKMAEGLKVAYKEREVNRFIQSDDSTYLSGMTKFGKDYYDKALDLNIEKTIQSGDFSKAVDLANQYKSNTGKKTVLDGYVKENSFEAYVTYHSTRGVYDYDQETTDSYVMLDVAAEMLGIEISDTNGVIDARKLIKAQANFPVSNKNKDEVQEILNDTTFRFDDYNKSEKNFINERAIGLMKMGLEPKKAVDKAKEMFDERDILGNGIPLGAIVGNSKTPKEDSELLVRSFSSEDSIKDTTIRYIGNHTWAIDNDATGRTSIMTDGKLRQRLFEEKKLEQNRNAILELSGISEVGKDTKVDKEIIKTVKKNIVDSVAKNFPDADEEMIIRQTQIAYREILNKIDEVRANRQELNREKQRPSKKYVISEEELKQMVLLEKTRSTDFGSKKRKAIGKEYKPSEPTKTYGGNGIGSRRK